MWGLVYWWIYNSILLILDKYLILNFNGIGKKKIVLKGE